MKNLSSGKDPEIEYDKEWITLISEAKKAGICKLKVRNFIKLMQHKNKVTQNRNS